MNEWVVETNHSPRFCSIPRWSSGVCECDRSWNRVSGGFFHVEIPVGPNDRMLPVALEMCVAALREFAIHEFYNTDYRIRNTTTGEVIPAAILGL